MSRRGEMSGREMKRGRSEAYERGADCWAARLKRRSASLRHVRRVDCNRTLEKLCGGRYEIDLKKRSL